MEKKVFFFGCWGEAGHFLRKPNHSPVFNATRECPFEPHDFDAGILLPWPEKVGTGTLSHIRGWTILSWWGNSPWDQRGKVNSAVIVEGADLSADEVWAIFQEKFSSLAPKLERPTLI